MDAGTIRQIRLEDALPCATIDCGRPALVATAYRIDVEAAAQLAAAFPGGWVIQPLCSLCAFRMFDLYEEGEEAAGYE